MKRITLISAFFVTLGFLLLPVVTLKRNVFNDAMSCRGVVKFHKEGQVLSFSVKQEFHKGKGIVILSGVLYRGNAVQGYISKTVSFHYVKNGGFYSLTSDGIIDSPQITMSLQEQKRWLPLFFSQTGKTLNLEIDHQGLSGWVVSADSVPLYLCEKSD